MQLIESKPITFRQVGKLLAERKKEAAGAELGYEQANTLAYAEAFGTITESKEEALLKEIKKVSQTLPQAAMIGLANLLPRKEEEVKQIILWSKADVPDEQVKELVKVCKKYRKA